MGTDKAAFEGVVLPEVTSFTPDRKCSCAHVQPFPVFFLL